MKKIMYKGHPQYGRQIIELFTQAGYHNHSGLDGHNDNCYYYIGNNNSIRCSDIDSREGYLCEQAFELKTYQPTIEKGKVYVCENGEMFICKHINNNIVFTICSIHNNQIFFGKKFNSLETFPVLATNFQILQFFERLKKFGFTFDSISFKLELIEGLVYHVNNHDDNKGVFIYKNTNDFNSSYLCGIDAFGHFVTSSTRHFGSISSISLATSSQRQALFEKIRENGLIYNSEKLSLEKIHRFSLIEKQAMIVRNSDTRWRLCPFQNIGVNGVYDIYNNYWEQCIPYDPETMYLIGTKDNPSKTYILK